MGLHYPFTAKHADCKECDREYEPPPNCIHRIGMGSICPECDPANPITNPTNEHRESAERFYPGVFIKEEMEARGWSIETLVASSHLKLETAEELIAGHRKVTPIYALCLSKAFGTGREVWINLQRSYDEWKQQQ